MAVFVACGADVRCGIVHRGCTFFPHSSLACGLDSSVRFCLGYPCFDTMCLSVFGNVLSCAGVDLCRSQVSLDDVLVMQQLLTHEADNVLQFTLKDFYRAGGQAPCGVHDQAIEGVAK